MAPTIPRLSGAASRGQPLRRVMGPDSLTGNSPRGPSAPRSTASRTDARRVRQARAPTWRTSRRARVNRSQSTGADVDIGPLPRVDGQPGKTKTPPAMPENRPAGGVLRAEKRAGDYGTS
jgi:hypothetical protein